MSLRAQLDDTQRQRGLTSRQQEVVGILLFALAIFSIISLHVQFPGAIGLKLKFGLESFFGRTAVVFGFLLMY